IRQTGGRGQYGHAKIRLVPRQPGEGYEFINNIVGGSIPKEFIKPIGQGSGEAMTKVCFAGYPVDDVAVELYDGSYHDVDSSEMAFKIAGSMAFKDAAKRAKPVLLEPVMRVEVVVPKDYMGDVMGNLASRRGQIQSQEDRVGTQIISARVPLSEMFGYATDREEQMDRAALAARGQKVARAVRDPHAQAAHRHLRADAADRGRADEARSAGRRRRRDKGVRQGAQVNGGWRMAPVNGSIDH